MKTYKEIKQELASLTAQMEILTKIVNAGCNKEFAHNVATLTDVYSIKSGYSMGELVKVCVKGQEVVRFNQCAEYRVSTYHATHGLVIFNFGSKKAFNEFARLTAQLFRAKERVAYWRVVCESPSHDGQNAIEWRQKKLAEWRDTYVDLRREMHDLLEFVFDEEKSKVKKSLILG